LNTGNTVANAAQTGTKKYAIFYKRNRDGSAAGVNPLVGGTEGSTVEYLNPDVSVNTSCVKGATNGNIQDINCTWTSGSATTSKAVISDLGVSDVEPILFQGDNTPSGFAAMTTTDVAKLTVKPSATQVFGVVVNTKLRNALQISLYSPTNKCNPTNALYSLDKLGNATTDPKLRVGESAACMPSLTTSTIASIFAGKLVSWKQIYTATTTATTGLVVGTSNIFDNVPASGTGSADKAASDRIHICTRTNGSGTKASFSAIFLNDICSDTGYAHPVETSTLPESILAAQVHQMSSGGNLAECLSELNNGNYNTAGGFSTANLPSGITGARWAIGIQGTENNASISGTTGDYRFIKIDGFEPSLVNVANGKYKNWSELTFQYNNVHYAGLDSSTKSLVDELVTQAANPTVMGITNVAALQSWGQSGFMAVPQAFAPASSAAIVGTKPVNPLSRGSKSPAYAPSTCRAAALYDGGANGLKGLQLK
jgi:ABC-type phosphate transport system substrate-binding protein